MKPCYKLFVPDEPSPDVSATRSTDPTYSQPQPARWRVVAELSVRFPRAMAQGRKLATHYGPGCIVAHAGPDGQPGPLRHACYVAPRTVEELSRQQLRAAFAGRSAT